jgi:hypothetical protein
MISPKRLIIEYEDGSAKALDFKELSREAWLELSKVGVCSPPPAIAKPSDHYVLLSWKDGWKEVIGIPKQNIDLIRYYVIERTEEIGRMAFDVTENYPLLFLVKRLPKQIESILIMESSGPKAYPLQERRSIREGSKVERIFFEKKDPVQIDDNGKKAENWVADLLDSIKAALKEKGLSAEELQSMNDVEKLSAYRGISKALRLWGMEKQEDLYGFLQLMTGRLAAS